jgi:hypothetical protein
MSYKVEKYLREDATSPYEEGSAKGYRPGRSHLGRIQSAKSQTEKEIDLRRLQEVKMALTRDFKETVKKTG